MNNIMYETPFHTPFKLLPTSWRACNPDLRHNSYMIHCTATNRWSCKTYSRNNGMPNTHSTNT